MIDEYSSLHSHYQELHTLLSGTHDGTPSSQLITFLRPRLSQLKSLASPFGTPSAASKAKVASGSITLADQFVLKAEDADKEFAYALSARFGIDEVHALVLLRSFLFNRGLPDDAGSNPDDTPGALVDELVRLITPFYYAERVALFRLYAPLVRAFDDPSHPTHEVAVEILPELAPEPTKFAEQLIDEYKRKTQETPPANLADDPRGSARWAKQSAREQLVLLEALFWTLFGFVPSAGATIVKVFEAAYATELGARQAAGALLLDEEGVQLIQDAAAVWLVLMLEVLELERVAEPGHVHVDALPRADGEGLYTDDPEEMAKLHTLVLANPHAQYAPVYLAWAFVLHRLAAVKAQTKEVPVAYQEFFRALPPKADRSYALDADSVHRVMARRCLEPEVGLFELLHGLLTQSPLFVTSVAWRTGSSITDPNAVAFRSVLKGTSLPLSLFSLLTSKPTGLFIGLIELVPVEEIPSFESFLQVWTTLFEQSEAPTVAALCAQFWQEDWPKGGVARRAVLDVARARFPVHPRPLLQLLRALSGAGFRDADPLRATADGGPGPAAEAPSAERTTCAECVFGFLDALSTFTQVIHLPSAPAGLYERVVERPTGPGAPGVGYTNTRPLKLPGGSILPSRSTGRLLSMDGADVVVVAWQHHHSGWKVVLEILTDYVRRRAAADGRGREVFFGKKRTTEWVPLTLEDVGVSMDPAGDEELATEALELVRSVVQDHSTLADRLMRATEAGEPVVAHTSTESRPPDLAQLATLVLEHALARDAPPCTPLVTAALGVLAGLLALPAYSARVWLFVRSTTALFGDDRATTLRGPSALLAAERVSGRYTMTLALLHLAQQLFQEASTTVHDPRPTKRLQEIREEVLLRAARFVHAEVWTEHAGWKYAQLGDRFEIGRRAAGFFEQVLLHAAPTLSDAERPFPRLSAAVADAFLYRATTATINPLVAAVASARTMLTTLMDARRFGDAHRLVSLLLSHLVLTRIVLNLRLRAPQIHGPCLLEQMLCARSSGGAIGLGSTRTKVDHVDVIASFIHSRVVGPFVPLEATWVLHTLCSCLSSQPVPRTISGHLAEPETTVTALMRIVAHPFEDPGLRNAIWELMALAVRSEPALAALLVSGALKIPHKKTDTKTIKLSPASSPFDTACDVIVEWKDLWEFNPHVLACILGFLHAVWDRALEHRETVGSRRKSVPFWTALAGILMEETGPTPDYTPTIFHETDGARQSELHDAVSSHAYRTVAKTHAVHIIALDIQIHHRARGATTIPAPSLDRPASYQAIQDVFKNEEQLAELVNEAIANVFDPGLHDAFIAELAATLPSLSLPQLQVLDPLVQREFGDNFLFSVPLLARRLAPLRQSGAAEDLERRMAEINLNLSLAHTQTGLTKAWTFLLQRLVPFLRGEAATRRYILALAGSISGEIAKETRSGELMAVIHSDRLALLLALVEVAWFSLDEKPEEVPQFIALVRNIRSIVLNPAQDPAACFVGQISTPFHRLILQLIYFCSRQCVRLAHRPKALNAEHRLAVSSMVDASLVLVVNALRITFDTARARADLDVDKDMELLVAVFNQCTQQSINPSTALWLTRCQESDVIRSSLELFTRLDLVGLANIQLLQALERPLYAPHVISFHTILAGIPMAAERLVGEGLLTAYANNPLSTAISVGAVDVIIPELPNARSPAHTAYCSMLAVVAGVVASVGRQTHFLASEMGAFVQLYADQIARATGWTAGDTLTLPLLDEIERSVGLFYAVAESTPQAAEPLSNGVAQVLRAGSAHCLTLLQQLNYALTHPNHLASLLEPVTAEERALIEADARSGLQTSATEHIDPLKRPLLARVLHRLFTLSNGVLSTLISISRADSVLTSDEEDWLLHEALVLPVRLYRSPRYFLVLTMYSSIPRSSLGNSRRSAHSSSCAIVPSTYSAA